MILNHLFQKLKIFLSNASHTRSLSKHLEHLTSLFDNLKSMTLIIAISETFFFKFILS